MFWIVSNLKMTCSRIWWLQVKLCHSLCHESLSGSFSVSESLLCTVFVDKHWEAMEGAFGLQRDHWLYSSCECIDLRRVCFTLSSKEDIKYSHQMTMFVIFYRMTRKNMIDLPRVHIKYDYHDVEPWLTVPTDDRGYFWIEEFILLKDITVSVIDFYTV